MIFLSWLNEGKEPLFDIMDSFSKYHSKLHLNQVILFFDRHGISFTKTMIQNYVRIGVLPPLYEKRYYIKEHIILLFFISSLKHVLSLDDLKLIFKGIHDFEELYNLFLNFSNSTDLISDLNISPISDELKKKLYLIIYYRNASIGKNLFNIL